MKQLLLASAALAATLPTLAQDYSYGRIRHVEGGATLQRASEPASEEAFRNLPFLPGDRIWTDESGRVELQFAGATILRLGARGKLDYVANEGERAGGRAVLRVWSGALMLRSSDGRSAPEFEIETPAGMVSTQRRAVVRIDTGYNETRIVVYDGSATLDDGQRRTGLEAGEELLLRRGEEPGRPRRLERVADDEFARWDEDRERQIDWASAQSEERYLPEEVAPYAADLRNNGSWHFDVDLGYVWQPRVAAGWQPYTFGRWAWSPYGWTWVPNEMWGWAPSHYGRWGNSLSLGWYWIPDRRWSPAWVSWSHGNDYVGWCPLGRGDRPVGYAVPRGASSSPWNYTRASDLTARDLPRRRVQLGDSDRQGQRVVENGYVDRSGRLVDGAHAQPRNVNVRPTPGDTIQELRSDPMTTIPFPVARRRYPSEDERREREGNGNNVGSRVRYEQERQAQQQGSADAERRRREAEGQGQARTQDRERSQPQPQPQSLSSWIERRRALESGSATSGAADRERDKGEQQRERATERERSSDKREGESADRDVMRRVFGPISGARSRDREQGDSASSGKDRGGERDKGDSVRSQPRRENPPREASPPPPPPRVEREREQKPRQDGDGGAARRKRDR